MVVDAMQTLYALNQRTAAFLRTDTHWSPEGMKAVATLLADTIRTTVPIAQSEAYRTMHGTLVTEVTFTACCVWLRRLNGSLWSA